MAIGTLFIEGLLLGVALAVVKKFTEWLLDRSKEDKDE